MAFKVVQTFDFEDVRYSYDRVGDVLYVSFGPPRPAVAVQLEDWFAIRLSQEPPFFVGMTIVGFKRISEKINRYVEEELAGRMERLARSTISIAHDDQTDTLIMCATDPLDTRPTLSVFEPLAPNVYLQKSLPSKDVIGVKIFDYTRQGLTAIEAMIGRIVDTIFEPERTREENARLITNVLMQHVDWSKLAAIAA
jgi:hypothetical protein